MKSSRFNDFFAALQSFHISGNVCKLCKYKCTEYIVKIYGRYIFGHNSICRPNLILILYILSRMIQIFVRGIENLCILCEDIRYENDYKETYIHYLYHSINIKKIRKKSAASSQISDNICVYVKNFNTLNPNIQMIEISQKTDFFVNFHALIY